MWGRDFLAGVGYSVLPPWGDTAGQSQQTGCSRAAAKAATDGLRRQLIERAEDAEAEHAAQHAAQHARLDLHGPSKLPPPLAAILRDHTLLHISALQHVGPHAAGGAPSADGRRVGRTPAPDAVSTSVSPQVAALVGYGRRRRGDTPLNGRIAALVGYGRRHHASVPLEKRGSDA